MVYHLVFMILGVLPLTIRSQQEFRVGVVMVEKSVLPFKMEMIGPAIDIAFEKAREDYGIIFRKFVKLYPGWCNAVYATGAIADLYYQNNISMLIGPGCSGDVTVCGKLATHWKLPQVTGVGDLVLGKEDYPTLTRLSYSLEKQSVFFTALLKEFSWRHVAIIYDTNDVLMRVQGNALRQALRAHPTLPRPYDIEFQTHKNPDFKSYLTDAASHARVIIFLSSGDDLRQFMLQAQSQGMTNGDFAFITIELFRSEAWGDFSWKRGDDKDLDAKKAFESLLVITLTEPSGYRWDNFRQDVISRAKTDYNFTYEEEVNYFVGAFYDGVIYLALALNRTIQDGHDPYDGMHVAQKLWNSTFPGIMGDVYIDDIGDRIADYSLLDMTDTDNGTFQIVGNYYGAQRNLELRKGLQIHWPGHGAPPRDVPMCGFKGDECNEDSIPLAEILVCTVLGIAVIVAITGAFIYRRLKFEAELRNMSWKVKWDDVVMTKNLRRSMGSASRLSLNVSSADINSASGEHDPQIFTTIGHYHGNVAAIRKIARAKIVITREIQLQLKQMREAHHDNITRFIGACVEPGNVAILAEYCPKGSLQDILGNEAIELDWLFKYSLTNDIIRGMIYLHKSPIQVHGRLKSSNCVVDNRFVLKITDFGLPSFYNHGVSLAQNIHGFYRQKLWRAPELLDKPSICTTEGDVYSFGIILSEIITRTEPYESFELSPKEIIDRVKKAESPPFRPKVDRDDCSLDLIKLMETCWSQDPQRLSFQEIYDAMKRITKDKNISGNILDNLLSRMSQYAENLESLVEERTLAFLDEKKRSEELLYRVLPKSVADQLKQNRSVLPEAFECVSIYFSDIVGFTNLSAASTPLQIVNFLNDLYTCFDAIIDDYDVYKVETIGDAYMVVSGLPLKNGSDHARQIAVMSLALISAVKKFRIRHRPDDELKLRVGLHSGPCVAGVVGLLMPRYCLFGDTVNTASRMESNGEAQRIHISSSTKTLLDSFGTFRLSCRGDIEIKGKGKMTTYWLEGENSDMVMVDL